MRVEAIVDSDGNALEARTNGPAFCAMDRTLGRLVVLDATQDEIDEWRAGGRRLNKAGRLAKVAGWKRETLGDEPPVEPVEPVDKPKKKAGG